MKDYKDIFSEAGKCMESAQKAYCNGDIDGANKLRIQANKLYDSAEDYVKSDDGKLTSLYGENRNFGIILNVILENVDKSNIGNKKVRRTLKEVITAIKGDPVLQSQYNVYNALAEDINKEHAEEYIDRTLSFVDGMTKKQIKESNEHLINVIRKCGFDELVHISDSKIEQYDLIENAILSRIRKSDVNGYISAVKALNEELISDDKSGDDELTSDEEALIEDVLGDDEKAEERFNSTKTAALEAIKQAADKSHGDSDELNGIYEDISGKTFKPGLDAVKDIAEFEEIINVIKD